MKLGEYKDLCDREWSEARGDVQALHLTNGSLLELSCEILLAGAEDEPWLFPMIPLITSEDVADIRAGAVCREILNPITRSVVRISGDSGQDMAEVRRHYGSETAPIPVNPGRALEAVRSLGAAQRKTADDLRGAITKAREAGVTWQAIAGALEDRYENVLRQYKCGSPIVVVRARQNAHHP